MTTAGKVTVFNGTGIDDPKGIAAGPDGAIWFTNGTSSIGRITPSGKVTIFSSRSLASPAPS
jgi:streptogramin lyase